MRSSNSLPCVLLVVLLGALLGCTTASGPGGGTHRPDDDDAGDDDTFGDDDDDDTGGHQGVDLTGVWAQRFCQNEHYDTALGSADGTRVTIARIDLVHAGNDLHETSEVCGLSVPPVGEVQVTFPDALIDGIPVLETSRTLGSNDIGAAYENLDDPLVQLVAWHPDGDASNEPLPTDPSDPRVFDIDHDGLPGGTVYVDAGFLNGEMYVAARTILWIDGEVISETEIAGTVEAVSEQVTLGASNVLFEQTADVTQMPGSTFRKVAIDAGMNCDAIVAQANALFGPCPTFP